MAAVHTIAGSHRIGCEDGDGAHCSFNAPYDVLRLDDGSLLVSDTGSDRIRRVYRGNDGGDLQAVAQVATLPSRGWLRPMGLARLDDGSVVVADHGHNRIRRLSADLATVSILAGTGLRGRQDGDAAQARFDCPTGVCVWRHNVILVTDKYAVRAIVMRGKGRSTATVHTLAGGREPGFVDGPGAEARFRRPGMIVCHRGAVLLCDTGNHAVRHLVLSREEDGMLTATTLTLCGGPHRDYVDGSLAAARFSSPCGLCLLPSGEVLVGDAENNCIRAVRLREERVVTLAGQGFQGWGFKDGRSAEALFNAPRGLTAMPARHGGRPDAIFVADSGNNCVRVLTIGSGVPQALLLGQPTAPPRAPSPGPRPPTVSPSEARRSAALLLRAQAEDKAAQVITARPSPVRQRRARAGTLSAGRRSPSPTSRAYARLRQVLREASPTPSRSTVDTFAWDTARDGRFGRRGSLGDVDGIDAGETTSELHSRVANVEELMVHLSDSHLTATRQILAACDALAGRMHHVEAARGDAREHGVT